MSLVEEKYVNFIVFYLFFYFCIFWSPTYSYSQKLLLLVLSHRSSSFKCYFNMAIFSSRMEKFSIYGLF